jgi:HEAT repeat protein
MDRGRQRLRQLTLALQDPAQSAAAAHALAGVEDPAAAEGLHDLLTDPPDDACGVAAVRALAGCRHFLARDALRQAARGRWPHTRLAALRALRSEADPVDAELYALVLRQNSRPRLRREAVRALAGLPVEQRWPLLTALSDPIWRVRLDAIRHLLGWLRQDPHLLHQVRERLGPLGPEDGAATGALRYLKFLASPAASTGGEPSRTAPGRDAVPRRAPWWDDDPPALEQRLRHVGEQELRAELAEVVRLIALQDARPVHACLQRLRRFAVNALVRLGEEPHLAAALRLLDEPRRPFVAEAVARLVEGLGPERRQRLARWLLQFPPAGAVASLVWALEQATDAPIPPEALLRMARHPAASVRAAAVRRGDAVVLPGALADPEEEVRLAALDALAARPELGMDADGFLAQLASWPPTPAWRRGLFRFRAATGKALADPEELRRTAGDPDPELRCLCARLFAELPSPAPSCEGLLARLQDDPDYRVRAAALTRSRAEALWERPEAETSWRVLRRAAALLVRPLAEVAPWIGRRVVCERGTPATVGDRVPQPRAGSVPPPASARPLGATGLLVSPLGISGRHGLPGEGFGMALDAGVNLFFWEPGYRTQTRFWQRLPASVKERLVVVAGTFAAEPRAVRRDLEQALQELRVERLGVFLLSWVRSARRLSEEVMAVLERARAAGLTQALGLSTHHRALALDAVRDGWDVIMVRHSLAHRGAEDKLFPLVARSHTGVLTFSNLCYGLLLRGHGGPAPQAADCYRYSLSQPGVSACLSAPRDLSQLRHNLTVLSAPVLDPEAVRALLPTGRRCGERSRAFLEWVRSR